MSTIQVLFFKTSLSEEIESSSCFWIQRQFMELVPTLSPNPPTEKPAVLGPPLALQEANSHFQLGKQKGKEERYGERAADASRADEDTQSVGKTWSLGLKNYILLETQHCRARTRIKHFGFNCLLSHHGYHCLDLVMTTGFPSPNGWTGEIKLYCCDYI